MDELNKEIKEENSEQEASNKEEANKKEKEKKISISKYNSLQKENEDLKNQINEWKNKYYTAYADIDNLRKSIEKDHREALRYRASGFIDKLLPALDSFNMAISVENQDPKIENFLQGFKFVYKNLINALQEEGVTEIRPNINDKFDENIMHAIDTIESDGPENLVAKVYTNGYKLHDRIIRPAMVYVTKAKQDKNDDKSSSDINKENKN